MFRDFNHKLIFKIIGGLLLFKGLFLLSAIIVAIVYDEHVISHFLITSGLALLIGAVFFRIGKDASPAIGRREGSVIVCSIWLFFTLIGLLPYWLSGSIPDFSNAFFESMSGFTATGATILNNIEELPKSILFWRSMSQWIGGIGIVVISLAVLPIFGFSSVQLFNEEMSGPTKDKIHPKMSGTAKRLLSIYLLLTVTEMILLVIAGMGWYDAINHSFTTIATGGFSTKQASIGYWDSPMIQYIIIFFMFFSGVNFSLFYFLYKGKFSKVFGNQEFRFFVGFALTMALLTGISMVDFSVAESFPHIEEMVRNSLFVVVSIMTTTGYGTVDYTLYSPVIWIVLIVVMLAGGSAGSTSGGMKQIRVLLLIKYAYYEFKRIIHPNAIFPVKYNNMVLRDEVITRVLAFILVYMILIVVGAIILAFSGMSFIDSLSGMIACISNIGPALGSIGPADSYSHIPVFSKWFLSFVMLVGRLEVFTVIVIFTPVFWKR